MSGRETAIMRAMLTAALFIGALATAPSRGQSAALSVGPSIALGPHHCGEIWKKASQWSRGKLSVKLDLSDADQDALAAQCGARNGFAGRRTISAFRRRTGRTIWGSCFVP
jgi:hypothetical protein